MCTLRRNVLGFLLLACAAIAAPCAGQSTIKVDLNLVPTPQPVFETVLKRSVPVVGLSQNCAPECQLVLRLGGSGWEDNDTVAVYLLRGYDPRSFPVSCMERVSVGENPWILQVERSQMGKPVKLSVNLTNARPAFTGKAKFEGPFAFLAVPMRNGAPVRPTFAGTEPFSGPISQPFYFDPGRSAGGGPAGPRPC